MKNSLEGDYQDFIEIQGLKDEKDISRAAHGLQFDEQELFNFLNEHVVRLSEEGLTPQNVGELLGTIFLFAYWLRGVRESPP